MAEEDSLVGVARLFRSPAPSSRKSRQALSAIDVPWQTVLPLVARFLTAPELSRLAYVNRELRRESSAEACWVSLLARDYEASSKVAYHAAPASTKRSQYSWLYQTACNWQTGRARVTVHLSGRKERLLAMNDWNFFAEVNVRTGAWQVFHDEQLIKSSMNSLVDAAVDCDLSDSYVLGSLLLVGGGRGCPVVEAVESGAQTILSTDRPEGVEYVERVRFIDDRRVLVRYDRSISVWDVTSASSPIWSVEDIEDTRCVGLFSDGASRVCFANRDGLVTDYDLRIPHSSRSERLACRDVTELSIPLDDFDTRYYATGSKVALHAGNEIATTSAKHIISSLVAVDRSTVILAYSNGWNDPMELWRKNDESPRRMSFAVEKYYRIRQFKVSRTTLGANCSDKNRIFTFSPYRSLLDPTAM